MVRPPISAIERSESVDINTQVAMIRLFQRHSEGYDSHTLRRLGGLLLNFYRPYRPKQYNPLAYAESSVAALKVLGEIIPNFRPTSKSRTDYVKDMIAMKYDKEVLQWAVTSVSGYFRESDYSVVCRALIGKVWERDMKVMRMIVAKTKDLSKLWDPKQAGEGGTIERVYETATSLAMIQQSSFMAWREIICEQFLELGEFLRKELEVEPLRREGWTENSLRLLFESELPDIDEEKKPVSCERCCAYSRFGIYVDLEWKKMLRNIRSRYGSHATEIVINFGNPIETGLCPGVPVNADVGVEKVVIVTRPYRFVCLGYCKDGFAAPKIFDGIGSEEPEFPLFEEPAPTTQIEEEDCPSLKMPGAFKLD